MLCHGNICQYNVLIFLTKEIIVHSFDLIHYLAGVLKFDECVTSVVQSRKMTCELVACDTHFLTQLSRRCVGARLSSVKTAVCPCPYVSGGVSPRVCIRLHNRDMSFYDGVGDSTSG